MQQVRNGLSYVTEDLKIAEYILEKGFPKDFNEANNAMENGNPDLKFETQNICRNFLHFYKTRFDG